MKNKIIAVIVLALLGGGSYLYLQNQTLKSPEAVLEKFDAATQKEVFSWLKVFPFEKAMKNELSFQIDMKESITASPDMPLENFSVNMELTSLSDFSETLSELDMQLDLHVNGNVQSMGEAKAHLQLETQLNKDFFVFQIPTLNFSLPMFPEPVKIGETLQGAWFDIPWEMLNQLVPAQQGLESFQEMVLANQRGQYSIFIDGFKELIPNLDIWEPAGEMQVVDGWYEFPLQSSAQKLQASYEALMHFIKSMPQGELYAEALLAEAVDFEALPVATGLLRVSKKDLKKFTFESVLKDDAGEALVKLNLQENKWSLVTQDTQIEILKEEGLIKGQVERSPEGTLLSFEFSPHKEDGWKGEIIIPSMMGGITIDQADADLDEDEQEFMIKGAVTNALAGELFQFAFTSEAESIKAFDLVKPAAEPFESFVMQASEIAQSFGALGAGFPIGSTLPEGATFEQE